MLGDMLNVSIAPIVEADHCGSRRWNDDLDFRPECLFQAVHDRAAIIGAVGQKPGHRGFDPGDELGQSSFVPDMVCGQQGSDDLAADRVVPDVQFAPGFAGLVRPMLGFLPARTAMDLQPSAVHDERDGA